MIKAETIVTHLRPYDGFFDKSTPSAFFSEYICLKRSPVDFSVINVHQNSGDWYADNLEYVVPRAIAKVEYVRNSKAFRVPFVSTLVFQPQTFYFDTCGQDSRITITIDDSNLPNWHSQVYFDSSTQEIVFLKDNTDIGTYTINVRAYIRTETKYISSLLQFEFQVVD